MNVHLRALLLASMLGMLVPCSARADRREFYTLLSIEPGWFSYRDPLSSTASAATVGGGAAFMAYYGLTNSFHLGGVARYGYSRDLAYDSVAITLPDGTPSQGKLFQNHSQIGIAALALYRFDTGRTWAPVLSVEAGIAHHSFSSLEHIPDGGSFSIFFPDQSETDFFWRPALSLEYRWRDRFIGSLGAAVTMSPSSHARLQATFPLTVGVIW